MSVLVLACFISSMTNSATSISLPNIIATLGTTQALAQNLISFYSICLGIVSACSAFLVNKFNTRPFFMTCVGLFCLASVGLTFSTNIWMALAFKILQGLAAGSLTPMATMVALAIYPADRKGFGTSIIGMVMFASPALAPTIREMWPAVQRNILYRNTLKYMFSTTQAICPMSPKMSMAAQKRPPSFFCICSASLQAVSHTKSG